MITKGSFMRWLDDSHIDYIDTFGKFPSWMGTTDSVVVRLISDSPDRKDHILSVGGFGRIDRRLEVNYLGLNDLWDLDEIESFINLKGLKKGA